MGVERKINLVIADMTFQMTIHSEREEELSRKAAKQINDKLNKYRVHFPKEGMERIVAMVTLDFACKALTLEEKNDTQPFKDKLTALTRELEELFEKED